MRKIVGVLAIVLLGLGACVQEPTFSSTPAITFKSIQKITKISNDDTIKKFTDKITSNYEGDL